MTGYSDSVEDALLAYNEAQTVEGQRRQWKEWQRMSPAQRRTLAAGERYVEQRYRRPPSPLDDIADGNWSDTTKYGSRLAKPVKPLDPLDQLVADYMDSDPEDPTATIAFLAAVDAL